MRDNRLWQILAAPQQASERPTNSDWLEVEGKFCPLPADFKAFLADYGTGSIGGFVWLFNPASRNENLNLARQIDKQLAALQEASVPGLRLYPADEGILPFGITDNGDLLAWRVHGKPDAWPVIVVDSRAPKCQTFDAGFSQFLAGILGNELVCDIFPDDFPDEHPVFSPL
jgi:hypothetical protein